MVFILESGIGMELWEKVVMFSREILKGGIIETTKKESQKDGHTQVCLIASVS